MALQSVPGQATLPSPRTAEAPYFSGQRNDPIVDFLFEYDTLTTNHGLSHSQKVETIVHYIAPSVRDFWKTLDGYSTGDWATFKSTLESLYPDTSATKRYTKRALQEFVDDYAKTRRMRDEDDVMDYYRDFLALSNPLYNNQRISDEERSFEFFQGFHPDDRRPLAFRLLVIKPDHPIGVPHDLKDVLTAARRQFSGVQLSDFLPRELRDGPFNLREPRHADPDQWMRQSLGREDRHPRPRQELKSQYGRDSTDDRDSWNNDDEPQREHDSPRDRDFQDSPDYDIRTVLTDHGPRLQGQEDSLITQSDDPSSYFRLRTRGCIFCAEPGHHVRQCSTAKYYTRTNRILILNDRLHLPNGQPIPNDGNGRGLKPAIDKWLAANPVRPAL
ncbi:hypothetical protein EDB83DRAFT_998541 [Lactarius deliciosus]|nr:hypothetical protein EDB83DRAFT_998541 [Lactarius deliciosus]